MARSRSDSSEGRAGLVILIVLSAVLLFVQRDNALDRRTTPLLASDVQAPVAALLSLPFRRLEGALADVEDSRRALEENKVLRAELARLRAQTDQLQAMRARQLRLEALLAVERTGDIPDRRIAARAVSDPSSPFVRSLLIGSGRDAGIFDGYAVQSEHGLVGHVVSAGRRSARVLRLDDLNSRVAVINERTGARAILAGANSDRAGLKFVDDANGWDDGDRVLTSGDDGRLPKGLPVGRVVSASAASGDSALQVELDFQTRPVDWVFVIPYDGLADADDVDLTTEPNTDVPIDAEQTEVTQIDLAEPVRPAEDG